MTTAEVISLVAILVGPIAAVSIAFMMESRRRDREQKMLILRALMTTRHLVGDPNYSAAINLIPVEFSGNKSIQDAYIEFIEAAYADVTDENRKKAQERTATKQTRLIYEITTSMGYKIAETDLQSRAYASEGWVERDNMMLDSQRAVRDIATILHLQARQMEDVELNEHERKFLGLEDKPN